MLEAYCQLHLLECEDAKATGDRRLLARAGSCSPSRICLKSFQGFQGGLCRFRIWSGSQNQITGLFYSQFREY